MPTLTSKFWLTPVQKYSNVGFLQDLFEPMTRVNPDERPDASEVSAYGVRYVAKYQPYIVTGDPGGVMSLGSYSFYSKR